MQNNWYGPLNTKRMQQNAVKNVQQNQIVAVLSLLQAILVAAI